MQFILWAYWQPTRINKANPRMHMQMYVYMLGASAFAGINVHTSWTKRKETKSKLILYITEQIQNTSLYILK